MPEEQNPTPPAANAATPPAAPAAPPAAAPTPPAAPPPAPPIAFSFDEKGVETVFGKAGDDGRPANVAAKYWDADKKALKADVVFNQLKWAESKLGKSLEILGAPPEGTEYAITVPEGVPVEIPTDDPAVRGLFAIARKHDVSQAFVDELVAEVAKNLASDKQTNLDYEIKQLGENGTQRLKDMSDFLRANLPPEYHEAASNMVQTAEQLAVMEKLIARASPTKFHPKDSDSSHVTTGEQKRAEWEKLYFAVNDKGERMMAVDAEYRKRVDALRDEAFGTTRRDAMGRVMSG
jgi:hypothetical protein